MCIYLYMCALKNDKVVNGKTKVHTYRRNFCLINVCFQVTSALTIVQT